MGFFNNIKKLLKISTTNQITNNKKFQTDIQNTIKEKLTQNVEDQYNSIITTNLLKGINEQILETGEFNFYKYMGDRLVRYSEYNIIQQKIPEQENAVSTFYDLVVCPELYTSNFIDFKIYSSDQISEVYIERKQSNGGGELFKEKIKINLQTYLDIYQRRNNLYKIIKKQIYDAIFYGDQFVEIVSPQYDKQEQISEQDNNISNLLLYYNISPKNVIILQMGNLNLGYLVIPDIQESSSIKEKELITEFLLFLMKELDTNLFKSFTKNQIMSESMQNITESSMQNLNNLFKLDGDIVDSSKSIFYESIHSMQEFINTSDELQRSLQRSFKEQTVNSQLLQDKFTMSFQMDISKYIGSYSNTRNNLDITKLMDISPIFGDIQNSRNVRYILPNRMQHFSLTSYKYSPYGQGLLDPVRSIQSLILLLEYQMIIYRLTKQPDRKKYTVDISGIQKEKIPEYVNRIKNELKSQKSIDINGNLQENLNLVTLMEDYFVLKKGGVNLIDIDNVEGQSMENWYNDMKYWHDKLLSQLKIPPSYLGFSDSTSGVQTVLTIQDHRVQRQILKLQGEMNEGIMQLFEVSFEILNFIHNHRSTENVDKTIYQLISNNELDVKLYQPTSLEQKEKQDQLTSRINLIKDIEEMTNFRMEDLLVYFGIFTSTELQDFQDKANKYQLEHPEEKDTEESKNQNPLNQF